MKNRETTFANIRFLPPLAGKPKDYPGSGAAGRATFYTQINSVELLSPVARTDSYFIALSSTSSVPAAP